MLCLRIGKSWLSNVSKWPAMAIRGFSNEVVTPEMLADTNFETVSAEEAENRISHIRNKSNLKYYHRRQMNDEPPYVNRVHWFQSKLKYQQKLFGTYGNLSQIDPKICWMTKTALKDQNEYESIANPFSLQQMLEKAEKQRLRVEERAKLREKTIEERLSKLGKWRKELRDRVKKKTAIADAAKKKREQLIDEVRRHFGFKMNPKDQRFQELLAEKEKLQKKAEKAAKLATKESLILKKLQANSAEVK